MARPTTPNHLHARGAPLAVDELRRLQEVGLLVSGGGIVVRLAPRGLEVLRQHASHPGGRARTVPEWDAHARVLNWRGRPIKRLLRHAPSQATLLAVFQEQGWPDVVDDPLPGLPEGDAAARLRDTVRNLNSGILPGTIRFYTDGTGEGVGWSASRG